jgi:hypothetical protein
MKARPYARRIMFGAAVGRARIEKGRTVRVDKRAARIAEFIKPLPVKPGSRVNLATDSDPG